MTRERDALCEYKIPATKIEEQVTNIIDDIVMALQKTRNSKNISQYKLAQMTGLSHTTIMRIENYTTTPSLEALLRIAVVLEMDWNILHSDIIHDEDISYTELSLSCPVNSPVPSISIPENTSVSCDQKEHPLTIDTPDKKQEALVASAEFFPNIAHTIYLHWVREIFAEQYIEKVKSVLADYTACMAQSSIGQTVRAKVEELSNSLILVLREYFMGQHTSAYELFSETVSQINIASFYSNLSPERKLYRARRRKKGKKLCATDFLHIPLERRTKVSSQRYSFPGLPCLYLGTSQNICLLELGCNFDNAVVAQLTVSKKQTYRILDLTGIFSQPAETMNLEDQKNFLELLPLVYLCSTEIKLRDEAVDISKQNIVAPHKADIAFRPDYIIPQLLLEYILDKTINENDPIIGIQYFSVQEDFYSKWLNGQIEQLQDLKNIVIPVQTDEERGHCIFLKNMVDITDISDPN